MSIQFIGNYVLEQLNNLLKLIQLVRDEFEPRSDSTGSSLSILRKPFVYIPTARV